MYIFYVFSLNANNNAHYSTECTSSYLCVNYDDICEIGCPVPSLLNQQQQQRQKLKHILKNFQMQTPSFAFARFFLCVNVHL